MRGPLFFVFFWHFNGPEMALLQSLKAAQLTCVVKKIEKYQQEHGEPPAPMMAVYDYLHKKEMSKAAMIKSKQDMWRQS
jgi:hypothetical protein